MRTESSAELWLIRMPPAVALNLIGKF